MALDLVNEILPWFLILTNGDWLFTRSAFVTVAAAAILVSGVLGYLYGPYCKVRRVPGPPPIPLVGHIPLLARYGPDVFSVLAKRYGPIFRLVFAVFVHSCSLFRLINGVPCAFFFFFNNIRK